MDTLVRREKSGSGVIWVMMLVSALFAVLALGAAAPAYAEGGAGGVSVVGAADSGLSVQSSIEPQASSKGSKYGLLAKNGYVYPCDKKGRKIAKAWSSGSLNGATDIKKLFVAANAKKVPTQVKYRIQYRFIGVSAYKSTLSSLMGKTRNVTFLLKGGKSSCKAIEGSAFGYRSKLKTVSNFNKTKVKTIGESAFYASGIKKISLPKTLKAIGSYAFGSCESLKTVKGLNKTKIAKTGKSAFYQSSVKSISLPKTCKTVSSQAFRGCRSLKTVKLGAKVSLVESWAFYGCKALASVVLPESVRELGTAAFTDCMSLKSLTMKSPTMVVDPDSASAFMTYTLTNTPIADESAKAYIYVPKSVLAQYQVPLYTNPWYSFAGKFRAI